MRYVLPPKSIKLAKKQVKKIEAEIKTWEKELCRACEDKETMAKKFYPGVNKRIDFFKKEIENKKRRLKEFKEAIKNGYI